MTTTQSPLDFFRQIFSGSWITQGVWVAAEIGIDDMLADGPLSLEKLAEKSQTDAGALCRLMRALAETDIFFQNEQEKYHLTPHSRNAF